MLKKARPYKKKTKKTQKLKPHVPKMPVPVMPDGLIQNLSFLGSLTVD
jgi:hypothetical protein